MQKEKNSTIKDIQKKQEIGIVKRRDTSENQVNYSYLSIGSNLGDKILNLEKVKYLLKKNSVQIIKSSSYYVTNSWPNPKFPKFLNAVLYIKTSFNIMDFFRLIKSIEKILGRKKSKINYPRKCDIDIIDFNGKILELDINSQKLSIPHPRMHKRNFVLFPLFELNRKWFHPKLKRNIVKLIGTLANSDLSSIKIL